jgi:excinuclease ABC subunit C
MLDGGLGQLSSVKRTLDQADVHVPLLALAKREELIYLAGTTTPIKLSDDSPARLILQELRDEAHRFGITYYRSRHRKTSVASGWDELPGVGPTLKRKLKTKFGSLNKLRQARHEDIAATIGTARARVLLQYLSTN